ncbi:unnamed protein product [Urochloa humidicola]
MMSCAMPDDRIDFAADIIIFSPSSWSTAASWFSQTTDMHAIIWANRACKEIHFKPIQCSLVARGCVH